jgi:hypothetical protein|nr:MAG TPA: PTRF/SDPR family [Caudoviricetes sp.]
MKVKGHSHLRKDGAYCYDTNDSAYQTALRLLDKQRKQQELENTVASLSEQVAALQATLNKLLEKA